MASYEQISIAEFTACPGGHDQVFALRIDAINKGLQDVHSLHPELGKVPDVDHTGGLLKNATVGAPQLFLQSGANDPNVYLEFQWLSGKFANSNNEDSASLKIADLKGCTFAVQLKIDPSCLQDNRCRLSLEGLYVFFTSLSWIAFEQQRSKIADGKGNNVTLADWASSLAGVALVNLETWFRDWGSSNIKKGKGFNTFGLKIALDVARPPSNDKLLEIPSQAEVFFKFHQHLAIPYPQPLEIMMVTGVTGGRYAAYETILPRFENFTDREGAMAAIVVMLSPRRLFVDHLMPPLMDTIIKSQLAAYQCLDWEPRYRKLMNPSEDGNGDVVVNSQPNLKNTSYLSTIPQWGYDPSGGSISAMLFESICSDHWPAEYRCKVRCASWPDMNPDYGWTNDRKVLINQVIDIQGYTEFDESKVTKEGARGLRHNISWVARVVMDCAPGTNLLTFVPTNTPSDLKPYLGPDLEVKIELGKGLREFDDSNNPMGWLIPPLSDMSKTNIENSYGKMPEAWKLVKYPALQIPGTEYLSVTTPPRLCEDRSTMMKAEWLELVAKTLSVESNPPPAPNPTPPPPNPDPSPTPVSSGLTWNNDKLLIRYSDSIAQTIKLTGTNASSLPLTVPQTQIIFRATVEDTAALFFEPDFKIVPANVEVGAGTARITYFDAANTAVTIADTTSKLEITATSTEHPEGTRCLTIGAGQLPAGGHVAIELTGALSSRETFEISIVEVGSSPCAVKVVVQ